MIPKAPDNEAIRELRDTVIELNKTVEVEIKATRRLSGAFMALAFVQVILAIAQFATEIIDAKYQWIKIVVFLTAMVMMILIIRNLDRN